MGIKQLLRFMKPYIEPIHIKKYSGKRVGIDAYSWLHKGAYSCSMELCLNSDNETKLRYINYFMRRIDLLRHHNTIPVVVFDGGNIPCKADTEQKRHRRRSTNLYLAMAKLKEGNVGAATEFFRRAVSITPPIAHQLIQVLRSENIEFVVAPYEADAQLAYMTGLDAENGGIVAVITEDSDLIAYGSKAIVFKMDRNGNGEEIVLDNVFASMDRKPSFQNFDKELFTGMCVLAGCDFLPSVPGIGICRSHALVSKYRNLDLALSDLKLDKTYQMPEDYPKSFREAISVFQHAQIYDVATKKLKHMRPVPEALLKSLDGELDFLGPYGFSEIPPSLAIAIAEGNLDPISMKAFEVSLGSRNRIKPVRIKTSGQIPRVEAPMVSSRESYFVVFSSQKVREKDNSSEEEEKCITINEVEALQKLIMPSTDDEATETSSVVTNIALKVPNNNPFKRRKTDQTDYIQTPSKAEEDLFGSDFLEDGPPRKRKVEEMTLDQVESVGEEISLVTRNEKSEVLFEDLFGIDFLEDGPLTSDEKSEVPFEDFESQESLNYKPSSIIIGGGKKKGRSQKMKNSKRKSSDTKNSSILNFFSPV